MFAGTSGYGFREWVGTFYPEKTKPADFLSHYASVFRTVELNYTFRRFPKAEQATSWAEATPPSFRFAVKANQGITHRARLADVGEPVASFLKALEPLGERLGPVLFQCPPWFRRDDERLRSFLAILPKERQFALEFRHDSWQCEEVEEQCCSAGVALVANISELEGGVEVPTTADFGYIRLRRDPPYSESERATIAKLLAQLSSRLDELYLYVKHDGPGLAPAEVAAIQQLGANAIG